MVRLPNFRTVTGRRSVVTVTHGLRSKCFNAVATRLYLIATAGLHFRHFGWRPSSPHFTRATTVSACRSYTPHCTHRYALTDNNVRRNHPCCNERILPTRCTVETATSVHYHPFAINRICRAPFSL